MCSIKVLITCFACVTIQIIEQVFFPERGFTYAGTYGTFEKAK